MANSRIVVLALLGLGACADNPASPPARTDVPPGGAHLEAVASTTSDIFPITIDAFVPCANGGAGEIVEVSGNLHQVFTTVIDATGDLLLRSHFQPQGISGVGLTSGVKYQATGVTQLTNRITAPFPIVVTLINNFRLIGSGPDNNLLVHEEAHVTVNANGVETVNVDKVRIECH
jgi:hypothetical protein